MDMDLKYPPIFHIAFFENLLIFIFDLKMASSSDDMSGVAHQGMIICEKCSNQFLYQMDSPPAFHLITNKTAKQLNITRTFKINICQKCMGSMGTNHYLMKMENLKAMFVNQYMRYQLMMRNMNGAQPQQPQRLAPMVTHANHEEMRKLLLRNAPLPEYQGRKILITNNNVFVRGGDEQRSHQHPPPTYYPFVDDSDEEADDSDEEDEDVFENGNDEEEETEMDLM